MMKTVSIDGAQLTSLDLYRMALSEGSQEKRLRAIEVVTHDVVARQLNLFASNKGKGWPSVWQSQVKQKEFPSLSEAEELLNTMPSKSLVDLRARAIFALAFSCKRTNVRFCEPFNKRSFLEQLCEYGK